MSRSSSTARGLSGAVRGGSGVARGLADQASTRERIVRATIASLRDEGFAGTSARSIARHGGFNQALIFYHYGSVKDLLLATIEVIGGERLADYRDAVSGVTDIASAVDVARRQYARDVADGHITVLAELIAGASSVPELGPGLVRCMEPWIAFAEGQITRLLRGTPLEALVPARDAAVALLAMYLGMELLDHLDPRARVAEPLFGLAARLTATLEPLVRRRSRGSSPSARRPRPVVVLGPALQEGRP